MSIETLISVLVGISTGIITGLYTALIVARYQRFADLRGQVLRIIREIDFVHEGARVLFPRRKEVSDFSTIASDLLFLQHSEAADKLLKLSIEINETISYAINGSITIDSLTARFSSWQDTGRSLAPSKRQLFRLWSGL